MNLIRLVALAAFYGYHLLNTFVLNRDQALQGRFHTTVSLIVFVWASGSVVLHVLLSRGLMRPEIPVAAVVVDLLLSTVLLCVCGNPHSMLATAYFLIVGSSSLRFSLPVVYLSTIGSIVGYFVFLGHSRFVLNVAEELRVTRTNQVLFVMALLVAGLLAGQSVRQVRRIAASVQSSKLSAQESQR